MRKTGIALLVLLMFTMTQTCLAANVPVYIEGQHVADGLEKQGSTYLPLRTMFESVGAEVEWNDKEQKITANFANGDVLTMKIGDEYAEVIKANGAGASYGLEQQPFMQQGITYVPLRFITETVLGYEVDWRNGAVWLNRPRLTYALSGSTFTLDLMSGALSKDGQTLGRLDLPSISNSSSWYPPAEFTVQTTPAGNYLFSAMANGSGALSFSYQLAAYIPAAGGEIQTCCVSLISGEIPQPFWQGDVLWLPDDDGSVYVNDKTGLVSSLAGKASGLCWWANEKYVLLGNGFDFDLYNLSDNKLIDLAKELITPEVKTAANEFLRSAESTPQTDEWREQYYWNYLGFAMPAIDPYPSLILDRAEGNTLHFNLSCAYWLPDGSKIEHKDFPLVYQLPE